MTRPLRGRPPWWWLPLLMLVGATLGGIVGTVAAVLTHV